MKANDLISLQQLVITSSLDAMPGKGIGPVGCSENWPFETRTGRDGGLGDIVSYSRDADAPRSLSVRSLRAGTCVLAKTPAGTDFTGRPGRYIVHALLDPTGTLHPMAALGPTISRALILEWPTAGRVDGDMPEVQVAGRERPILAIDPEMTVDQLAQLIAVVLGWTRDQRPLGLRVDTPDQAVRMLAALFAALPPWITERLTFSTYESEVVPDVALLAVSSDNQLDRERRWVDLVAAHPLEPTNLEDESLAHEIAEDFLAGQPATATSAASWAELISWAQFRRASRVAPDTLDARQLSQLLRHPAAVEWLSGREDAMAAAVHLVAATDNDPELAKLVAGAIARDKRIEAARLATVEALAWLTHGSALDRLSGLVEDLDQNESRRRSDSITASIANEIRDRLVAGTLSVEIAKTVAGRIQSVSGGWPLAQRVEFLRILGGQELSASEWTPYTEALVAGHLDGVLTASSEQVKRLIDRFPDQSMPLLQRESQAVTPRELMHKLALFAGQDRSWAARTALRLPRVAGHDIWTELSRDLTAADKQQLLRVIAADFLLAAFSVPPDITAGVVGAPSQGTPSAEPSPAGANDDPAAPISQRRLWFWRTPSSQ